MNINKAKTRSKMLPPIPKKEVRVIAREPEIIPEPVPEEKPVEIEVEVIIEPEVIKEPPPIVKKKKIIKPKVRKKPEVKAQVPVAVPKSQIKSIKKALDELDVKELPLVDSVFGASRKSKSSGYSFDDKFTAISLMKAFAEDREGKLAPNFTRLGQLLGVQRATLSTWWSQREDIVAGSKGYVAEMKNMVIYDLSCMVAETASILRGRLRDNPDKIKDENLIRILDKMINKISILSGDPTQRQRTDHYHHLPVKAIAPDSAL